MKTLILLLLISLNIVSMETQLSTIFSNQQQFSSQLLPTQQEIFASTQNSIDLNSRSRSLSRSHILQSLPRLNTPHHIPRTRSENNLRQFENGQRRQIHGAVNRAFCEQLARLDQGNLERKAFEEVAIDEFAILGVQQEQLRVQQQRFQAHHQLHAQAIAAVQQTLAAIQQAQQQEHALAISNVRHAIDRAGLKQAHQAFITASLQEQLQIIAADQAAHANAMAQQDARIARLDNQNWWLKVFAGITTTVSATAIGIATYIWMKKPSESSSNTYSYTNNNTYQTADHDPHPWITADHRGRLSYHEVVNGVETSTPIKDAKLQI